MGLPHLLLGIALNIIGGGIGALGRIVTGPFVLAAQQTRREFSGTFPFLLAACKASLQC